MDIYLFSCIVKCFAGVKMQTKCRRQGKFICIASVSKEVIQNLKVINQYLPFEWGIDLDLG